MREILQYLKEHGERLDSEIARDTGVSLAKVRASVSNLVANGEVITCHLIRFENGKRSEGVLYRAAGYIPPVGPGRKPKTQA